MALMSRAVRETVQTIAVIVAVLILIAVYAVYPLVKTKTLMARPDLDSFKQDSVKFNDPSAFVQAGLTVDTFRVEADGLTRLACVRLSPVPRTDSAIRGLAILVHREGLDRSALVESAKALCDSGVEVIMYDQRASGLSGGKYRSDGQLEASDLEALIGYLEIQGKLHYPLSVVGWGIGGDAAMLAAKEESRITQVIAIEPYLTTDRMLHHLLQNNFISWLPFKQTVFWWWYKIRSGYAVTDRTDDNLTAVSCRTVIGLSASRLSEPEIKKLISISNSELLTVASVEQVDPVQQVVGYKTQR